MKKQYKTSSCVILNRFLITLGIIAFIRIGNFLPVPGINQTDLAIYLETHPFTQNLISTFINEDNLVIGIFTLNIFPYINASILVQLILSFSPSLSKIQKEGGLPARRTINRLIKILTFCGAIIQSIGVGLYLKQVLFNWNFSLFFLIILWLTTGAMIVLWLSEIITDYGLGNGPSLLIYTNILSSFPSLFKTILLEANEKFTFKSYSIIACLFGLGFFGIVLLQDGVRKVPLVSAKQLNSPLSKKDDFFTKSYLPLKLTQAGVLPIVLTTTVLFIPNYLSNYGISLNVAFLKPFSGIIYWISYFVFILIFNSFYSRIVLDPKDIAEQLQKMAFAIPGIRPGFETAFYLKRVMKRLTTIGSLSLAILATIPTIIQITLNISSFNGLSITSFLIIAGVLVEILKEIEDILYSNIYNK